MATKTRKRIRLINTNSQIMFVREHSLFLHNLTSFEHMFIISNILKVENGDSNDIYDIVSN